MSRPASRLSPVRAGRIFLLLALAVSCTGCESVKFFEKRTLADPIMEFSDSPTEIHFLAKNTYSREASVGGLGASAGGGCGCY